MNMQSSDDNSSETEKVYKEKVAQIQNKEDKQYKEKLLAMKLVV